MCYVQSISSSLGDSRVQWRFRSLRVSLWLQLLLHFGCAKEGIEKIRDTRNVEVTSRWNVAVSRLRA